MTYYRTFKRTCKSFRQYAVARKITEETGLTYGQAQERCREYNEGRTRAQIRRGTMLEFEAQS